MNKLIIITGISGTGKTTLAKNIYSKIKIVPSYQYKQHSGI